MKKKELIKEAKSFMKNAKKDLKNYGYITPISFIFCKNKGLLVEGFYRNTNEKIIHFNAIRKMVKENNAVGIIFVTDSSIINKDTSLPSDQDRNICKAIFLTASIPTYCLQIIQTYSENGDKVEFYDEEMWEPKKGQGTDFSKTFVEIWDDHLKHDESKLSSH
jgi:hypothetical protein